MRGVCHTVGKQAGVQDLKFMYFVYILRGNGGWVYKGLTKDLDKRVEQHRVGRSSTAKYHLPLELVFVQICKNKKKLESWRNILNQVLVVNFLMKLV